MKTLVFVSSLLLGTVAAAQQREPLNPQESHERRATKAFINVTGDAKLAHRLWTFVDFELEDAGIIVTDTEADANVIISGRVSSQVRNQSLELGVVRSELTFDGHVEKIDTCASLSDGSDSELFEHSARSVAEKLRKKYSTAQTVKLDADSDMTASESFGADLPIGLRASGLTIVESAPADLLLKVKLVREKVPIETVEVRYEIQALSRENSVPFRQTGGGRLSAKLIAHAPDECPDRVADLDWLYANDPLFDLARHLVKSLRKNVKAGASPIEVNKK